METHPNEASSHWGGFGGTGRDHHFEPRRGPSPHAVSRLVGMRLVWLVRSDAARRQRLCGKPAEPGGARPDRADRRGRARQGGAQPAAAAAESAITPSGVRSARLRRSLALDSPVHLVSFGARIGVTFQGGFSRSRSASACSTAAARSISLNGFLITVSLANGALGSERSS